jgi:hypothetical protein
VKALLIIIAALILFGGLIMLKLHLAADEKKKVETGKMADIPSLENKIKSDSLYIVKDILYKDSGILIALDNPGKSGAETYFDKKFKLNDYSNINMVYIYQYDTTKPLQQASLDDAIMAKGKKMARFQEIWVTQFIDTSDGSCKPLKKYLQSTIKNSDIFQTQETSYQPESIHKMRVECKFKITDSLGKKTDNDITASVDTAGLVTLVDKPQ